MTANNRSRFFFDAEEFRQKFERDAFRLKFEIEPADLFSRESLVDAAARLPESLVEFNDGAVPKSLPEGRKPDEVVSTRQAILENERFHLWVGLKLICRLPEYRQVIHDLLASVEPLVNELYGDMKKREGFIFVSSPGAVVPYHMDPEHNFLVQIEGRKTVTIFDRTDPRVLTEEDIEKNYTIGHQRLALKPELEPLARHFELGPGDCLHIPISMPHYVVNDDSTSVSMSVTFKSDRAERRARVYKLNHHMRKLGWAPRPFGRSRPADEVKAFIGAIYLGARSLQRRRKSSSSNRY